MANPTIRYFGTTAAAAGDGTSWANRAALFTGGAWSTVITGFDFTTDAMVAYVGPGTHSISVALTSGLFANAPSATNPLILHGCDSSGNALAIPDPNWTSDMPNWDDSGLAVLATTTNISTINCANVFLRLLKFTASGATTNTPLQTAASMEWCSIADSSSNSNAVAVNSAVTRVANCILSMTGASYSACGLFAAAPWLNCRLSGVGGGGGSGNRYGLSTGGTASPQPVVGCTIFGFPSHGIATTSSNVGHWFIVEHCTIANNGGSGIKCNGTASQTAMHRISQCMITGNGAYGIDGNTNAHVYASQNRLRDNTSGNTNTFGNWPTDLNYTTDSDDSSEYVDAAGTYDFRIKNSATIWGSGYGVSEQAAASGGGGNKFSKKVA